MDAYGPWVPIIVVYSSTPLVYCLMLFVPETLKKDVKDTAPHADVSVFKAMKNHTVAGFAELIHSLGMLKNLNVTLAMTAFFIQNPLLIAYSGILTQYVSKHFGWKIAETSYLLSPLTIVHLVVLATVPWISKILVAPNGRFRLSSFVKDVRLAQASFGFLITAALMEGFSQGIVLFVAGLLVGTGGAATSPVCRAIITEYVDAEHTSSLYALVSIVETAGAMFGGPVLAWCFDVGLKKKGFWIGLPYLYIALLCTLALLAVSLLRAPKKSSDEDTSGLMDTPNAEEP